MGFLRWVALLSLAFWIGGLATLGSTAAPALFDTLEARDPVGGRELAGLLFGQVFERFHYASWIAAGVVLASLGARAALGPRPRRWGLRMWLVIGMLATSVASVFVIAPRIERIRGSVSGPVAGLPDTDARRAAFGRWHALSTGLMALTLIAGVGLISIEANDRHS
jgi:hypothetical protein